MYPEHLNQILKFLDRMNPDRNRMYPVALMTFDLTLTAGPSGARSAANGRSELARECPRVLLPERQRHDVFSFQRSRRRRALMGQSVPQSGLERSSLVLPRPLWTGDHRQVGAGLWLLLCVPACV